MLLSLQFPVVDVRGFTDAPGRSTRPGWPDPTPDYEFLRFFGSIRARTDGGLAGWAGENKICEARRAIRFSSSLIYPAKLQVNAPAGASADAPADAPADAQGEHLDLRCAFRRFYFDNRATGKFEVGITTRRTPDPRLAQVPLPALINHVLNLPVQIRDPHSPPQEPPKPCKLVQAGSRLARLYAGASTDKKSAGANRESEAQSQWVRPGFPLLFLQYDYQENVFGSPYYSKLVALPEEYGISLEHCLVPYAGGSLPLWQMYLSEGANRDCARTLRLYLLRLHAEYDSLRVVLKKIEMREIVLAPNSEMSDRVQGYLDRVTSSILRTESRTESKFTSDIAEIAREASRLMWPGEQENLLESIGHIRKNILDKVLLVTQSTGGTLFIQKLEVIVGDVFSNISNSTIVNKSIVENAFNKVKDAHGEETANALLALAKKIEESQDIVAGALFDKFNEEIQKPEPEKPVLRKFWDGMVKALPSIATVTEATAKLLPLFMG